MYSGNIGGAILGCLFAGFYLLRVYDMAVDTYVAESINIVVAGLSFAWAARSPEAAAASGSTRPSPCVPQPGATFVYAAIALSGMAALGARRSFGPGCLSLLLGGTVYTFSIILAVFLIGLWGGSGAGSFFARKTGDARMALAGCQILLVAAIAWTAYTLAHSLPFWPIDPWLSLNPWFNFEVDLARCVLGCSAAAAFLWGASFPLALAAAAGEGSDSGRLSGEIYAANTAGSILGALVFSLIVIPVFGTQVSQEVLIGVSALGAVVALCAVRRMPRTYIAARRGNALPSRSQPC